MNERIIPVTVNIDRDELREWAGKHADAGHHGVAHVLYQAANEVESITDQAIREAKAEAHAALERVEKYVDHPGNWSAFDGRRAHILALIRNETGGER